MLQQYLWQKLARKHTSTIPKSFMHFICLKLWFNHRSDSTTNNWIGRMNGVECDVRINSLKLLSPWFVFTVTLSTIFVCLAYPFVLCLVSLNAPRHIYGKMCSLMNDKEKKYHCDVRCARRVKLNLEYKKSDVPTTATNLLSFHFIETIALCVA